MTKPHEGRCFCFRCSAWSWNAAPVLAGFLYAYGKKVVPGKQGFVRVWCSWCVKWHTHGTEISRPGEILHRAAHCYHTTHDSPYEQHGYRIIVASVRFSEVRPRMREATFEQWKKIRKGTANARLRGMADQALPFPQPGNRVEDWSGI